MVNVSKVRKLGVPMAQEDERRVSSVMWRKSVHVQITVFVLQILSPYAWCGGLRSQ